MTTLTYIAKPDDSRCKWFSAMIPTDLKPENLGFRVAFNYFRRNADLELSEGDMIIDWEELHHVKKRGSVTSLGFVIDGEIDFITPTLERKQIIKKEGHKDLMMGSGDIDGVLRMAIFIRRSADPKEAFLKLKNTKKED